MFHPRRPSTPGNNSANRIANIKRSALLPLLIVMAIVGVVFSSASRSVLSSGAMMENRAEPDTVIANGMSDGSNAAGFVRSTANQASLSSRTQSGSPISSGAGGNEEAEGASSGSDDQVARNHAQVVPRFFPALPLLPSITASKIDALVGADDVNGDGNADPGDKITYTVTITNNGSDATNLKFSDTIDAHTTLFGTPNTSPIAYVDTYSGSGNIPLSLNVAGGVLANDVDPDTGNSTGLTVTEVQGGAGNVGVATNTTATGRGGVNGSVTLAANGSFTYEPPPGFEGADTFTYKTSDGTATDTATVTINISGMVWFIQNNGGGSNRGTFSNPFTTIASFNTANTSGVAPDAKNGDFIALRTGTGTYTETDGINLRNTQKLIGNAVQFNTVFTAATNSSSAYTTFAGAAASAPTIVTTGGNGVDLADSNTVRGLNVGNTPGFFGFNGSAVGSPVINTVNVTGTGGAINVSTSGAFGANVTFATLESSSSPGANISLVGVTGTLSVTSAGTGLSGSTTNAITINGGSVSLSYPGNVTKGTAGSLVNVSGGHTGTLTFPGTLSATLGDGLQFSNADGTYTFNGTTTLGGGDAGIDIVAGASGPAPLGSAGTFTFNANTSITNPTNEAILISGGTQSFTYSGSFSKSNGTRGILIQNNTGGTILFDGASATETKTITTTGAADAIDLLSNTGTTINFTNNNLALAANGTGLGFNATGAGTITVQGTGNTITSVSGTALNVDTVNIGLSGLTFQSISSNGGTNGIVLNATGTTAGTNGGLTVTGSGATGGSGGTIQNKAQGALFTSTINLTLKNMNFTNANTGNGTCNNVDNSTFNNTCQAAINMNTVTTVSFDNLVMDTGVQVGINGRTVTDLTLNNSTVQNFGDNVNENDLRFFNLTGTCAITNSTFKKPGEFIVDLRNNTGSLNLSVTGSTFDDTASATFGAAGFNVSSVLASTMTVTIDNDNFTKIKNAGLQAIAKNTSTMNLDITDSVFDPTGGVGGGIGRGPDISAQNSAKMNFNVNHNTKIYSKNGTAVNIYSFGSSTIQGRVNNNTDIRCGGVGSPGTGVSFQPQDNSVGTIEIIGNTISQVGSTTDAGIRVLSFGDGISQFSATADATITGNNISLINNGVSGAGYQGGLFGVQAQAGSNASDTIKTCADLQNNAITGTTLPINGSDNTALRTREGSAGSQLYLEGMVAGASNSARALNTWTGRGNTPAFNSASDAGGAPAYSAPPAGAPYNSVCRQPTNATAMLMINDPNNALAQSGTAFGSLGSTSASLTADYLPANQPSIRTQSESAATTITAPASAALATQAQTVRASLTAIAATTESADTIALAHTGSQSAQGRASVSKNPKAMQLSHALRVRTRTNALAAALVGPTFTIDGAGGAGFTLPAGKTITVTFKVTVNDPPNLVNNPYPTGGPQVSNQGRAFKDDNSISVLTDDPAPPVGPNGASDPTITLIDLYNSQTSVVSSNPSSGQGDPVTFTATVAQNQAGSPGIPTGTVTFLNDGNPITCDEPGGSTQPLTAGVATCTTSAILPGGSPHTITAQYNGDGNFDPSSGTTPQTVIACSNNPIVTSNANSGPNTLRDAITNICNAPSNNITFNLGAGSNTITVTSTLVIAKNVNITNTLSGTNGPLTVTANGGNFRVFRVDSPVTTASLSGFTVTGANTTGTAGGGIFVQNGTTTLTGMLFTGNTVINGGGGGVGVGSGATINIRNSTISGNTATSGGGIYNNAGTLNLLNVTVTNNTADGNVGGGPVGGAAAVGGGIDTTLGTATNIKNSIVAGNFATSSTNIAGTSTDQGNNILTGDPRLDVLFDNGGATRTHALLSDSTALDAGDNAAAAALTTDQRGTGFLRPRDAADADEPPVQTVDIGAFEADPAVENITDKTTAEDTPLSFSFNVGDAATAFTSVTAVSGVGDQTLAPNAGITVSAGATASTRMLSITPASNQNGTATITVTATKTISGKVVSMTDTFVLTVTAVNDPPSFVKGADQTVNEDAGAQTVVGWATSISQGPNESGQTPLTFNVSITSTTGSLSFSTPPAIDATTGNLTYTAAGDTFGTANVSVTLSDSGSNTPPNSNTSAVQTFVITVNPINDPPSFTKGPDQSINESAGPQTVVGWATGISQGPNESGQTPLTFNVSVTGTTGTFSFSTPPAIDATTGTLTYTVTNGTNGDATVSVTLSDSGPSAPPPNSNTSAAQTFTISVNGVNDPPVNSVPGARNIPQNTVLSFAGANLISVSDPDAASAPGDGVITVSLTATNGTLTLSTIAGLSFSAGDGTSDATMTFDGTIAAINTALSGMTFTPTSGFTGAASVQIVSNDQGKTGTGGVQTDTDTVNITVDPLVSIYINEVAFNPDASGKYEYIEFRGTPSSTIGAGTYFVAINGDAGNTGDVTTTINLSGLSFGSNGFLVLLQNGNTYTTAAGATVVTSTTTGFGGLPGGIFQADGGATNLEDDSVTFMLVQTQTGAAPTLTGDIDSNNDGTPDGSVFAGWAVRDSIGNVDGGAADHGYGALNYATTGSGASSGTVVPVSFTLTYVGRRGDTTGSAAADWVASGTLGGSAPNFTLNTSSTQVEPPLFVSKTLDHIGSTNFTNKPPVNTVPGAQSINEDVPLTFTGGTQISIADVDAGAATVKVTLTAVNGTISLSGTAGLTFTPPGAGNDGVNDTQMIFTGTITAINTALNNLTFAPTTNYNGPASVTILTDDLGNIGVDGAKTDSDTVNITVNPVNDPPSFVKGADQTVNEDAGAQTVVGWATSISQGPGETGQTLTFNVSVAGTTGNLAFSSSPAIDPATGNLTYTTSPNTNGSATINVTLSDNGSNALPNSNTSAVQSFTITVNAVNDAPTFQIASNPPAVNEDAAAQTVNSFATNFQPGPATATDETTISPQTLVGYTVTLTGTTGNLTFTSGPSINNAGTLTYTPTGNTSGTATFNVVATDSGSGTAPNVNQSAPVAFTITVNGQNDAPVLDNAGNMSLNAINEDVPNASNPGTLVGDIIASAGGDRITDVDAGAIEGIAVTSVDNANGTWQFSIDNGVNWTPFGTPNAASARLLAANALTRVRFVPNLDFNGTIDPGITFRAWDQTSGANGGTADVSVLFGGITAFSTATETASITVNQVNDAPTAVNDTLPNVAEDSGSNAIPFSALTGNDSKGPANESGQNLIVKTVGNPVGGTVSISGGNVLFTPTANYNGPASFDYTVEDNGTPPLTSVAAATVSFNVTPVADTPSVTNATTNEDTQTTSGLVITPSVNDKPVNPNGSNVTHFKITAITGGTLFQNNGTTQINNGDFITVAQGAAGLKFTPTANSTANGSFTVQASLSAVDAGLGGATVTATITVVSINDAPTLDALGDLSINEDAPLQTVNLTGITAGGAESQTLTVTATSNNTGLIPNPTVNYSSPNATGSITFTPVANQSGSALITVTLTDNGGTANGGVNSVVRTFTVTVNAVNDAPVNNVPGAQSTNENAPLTLSGANSISISDVDAGAAVVQVTLTATNGTLTLSSTSGLVFTVGDGTLDATMTFTGTIASINSALSGLVFTPTTGFHGAASVQLTTNDLGNTGAGGALTDTDTISITVNERSLLFNSTNYTVGEADGHATITVTRTGGTVLPASVDYETSDLSGLTNCNVNTGNASQRCDYTSMRGTVNFLSGQSSATFAVPIINDVYVEGPETLTLTLSNATGGLLGTPSVATLTINDDDTTPGAPNPIDNAAFFIRQQYLDFLNREPEPSGLQGWLDIINNCPAGNTSCDFIGVSSGFFRSQEFFDRSYFVFRFYETALGRKPTYDEYQHDIARLTGFLTNAELEQRKAEYAEEFSQRADFKALYDSKADGDGYVNAIVATAGVTPSNRTNVSIRQGALSITRGRALRELLESPEISQRFYNKAFVVVGYFAYLRREPDAQYLVWCDLLNNPPANRTYEDIYREMIRGFIQSQEYRARFGLP